MTYFTSWFKVFEFLVDKKNLMKDLQNQSTDKYYNEFVKEAKQRAVFGLSWPKRALEFGDKKHTEKFKRRWIMVMGVSGVLVAFTITATAIIALALVDNFIG